MVSTQQPNPVGRRPRNAWALALQLLHISGTEPGLALGRKGQGAARLDATAMVHAYAQTFAADANSFISCS